MIATLLVLHFIADFLLQSRKMGKTKSSDPKMLAAHMLIQWLVFLPFTNLKFATANMLIHGLIDWNIWRFYKLYAYHSILKIVSAKYGAWSQPPEQDPNVKAEIAAWQYWEDHWFYTTIGFDQLLHMLTLVLLAGWLL